jgi:WD repeat and SOF domain-containing protein 1
MFGTCGTTVDIWSQSRSEPIHTFDWGHDSFTAIKFNPVEVRLS